MRVSGGWHVLVGCLFLNLTSRRAARPALQRFFTLFPTPEAFQSMEFDQSVALTALMTPLGLVNRRVTALINMTNDWLAGKPPEEIYACGQYCVDSYNIFVRKREVEPRPDMDGEIRLYLEWVEAQQEDS